MAWRSDWCPQVRTPCTTDVQTTSQARVAVVCDLVARSKVMWGRVSGKAILLGAVEKPSSAQPNVHVPDSLQNPAETPYVLLSERGTEWVIRKGGVTWAMSVRQGQCYGSRFKSMSAIVTSAFCAGCWVSDAKRAPSHTWKATLSLKYQPFPPLQALHLVNYSPPSRRR